MRDGYVFNYRCNDCHQSLIMVDGVPSCECDDVADFENYVPPLVPDGVSVAQATPGVLPDPEWDDAP